MVKINSEHLNVWFDKVHVLKDINIQIQANEILGIIGPSNSGKTSFLRSLNRMNELEASSKTQGVIELDGKNIKDMNIELLRQKVGMVFALPLPLPLSIFDNVAYGARMHGIKNKQKLREIVERALNHAYIWDEVKDRLNESAFKLSGGQQQRLCIARTLAVEPEVILYDEPCSGLDPISTAKVEELLSRR